MVRFLLFLLIGALCPLLAKPPLLDPHDTKTKIEEILKAHVLHQELTPLLMQRALDNFVEELDPSKAYFLATELQPWLSASPALLQRAVKDYQIADFSVFEQIYEQMDLAIIRRNRIEKDLEGEPLPEGVHFCDFKDLPWTNSEEALFTRLLEFRALQKLAAEKLFPDNPQQFFQRALKRRLHAESVLKGSSKEEKTQHMLSLILKAVSSSLDSQTAYFTPIEANQFMIQVQQRLFGIGAQLRDDLTGFTVVSLIEGSPASQQLKAGDRIIAVNREPVVGMDIVEAVELVRGPQGSTVLLTILREHKEAEEETLDIEIIRGEVVVQEKRLETSLEPYGDGIIATIHLLSFYDDEKTSSTTDIRKALDSLGKQHKIYGVILDLRQNGGGVLDQAVAVTGLFISRGIVVSIKDNTGKVNHLRNLSNDKIWDGPLLVLTSRLSASAAEIVAQTLQDYGRAIVIGDPVTFGKGTFQTFSLENARSGKINSKGEFKVTRGRYYTTSGKSPQLVGVQANLVIPGPFSQAEIGEKYLKYPVDTDQISPHFQDDLSDVPLWYRPSITRLYSLGKQSQEQGYAPFLPDLQKNSQARIAKNINYQNFLKALEQKEEQTEPLQLFGQTDLQLEESLNVIKDLILLTTKEESQQLPLHTKDANAA